MALWRDSRSRRKRRQIKRIGRPGTSIARRSYFGRGAGALQAVQAVTRALRIVRPALRHASKDGDFFLPRIGVQSEHGGISTKAETVQMNPHHANRVQQAWDPRAPDMLRELAVIALLALFACFVVLA